jgi:hypothetical protein
MMDVFHRWVRGLEEKGTPFLSFKVPEDLS